MTEQGNERDAAWWLEFPINLPIRYNCHQHQTPFLRVKECVQSNYLPGNNNHFCSGGRGRGRRHPSRDDVAYLLSNRQSVTILDLCSTRIRIQIDYKLSYCTVLELLEESMG